MNNLYKQINTVTPSPLVLLGILLLSVFIILPPSLTVILITILTSVVIIVSYQNNYYFLTVFSGGFLFRVLIILFNTIIEVLPTTPTSAGNSKRAGILANNLLSGNVFYMIDTITDPRGLVANILSPFYIFIGQSEMAGRVGNAMISLLIGYIIFKLAIRITDDQTSLLASGIVLFWPTIVFRSVTIQREIVSVVALLVFLWATTQWFDSITRNSIIIAMTAAAVVYILRPENTVLLCAILGTIFIIQSRKRPLYLAVIALLVIPAGVYIVFNFDAITGVGSTLTPETIDTFAHYRAHGDAAYLTWLHYESWLDIILYAPLKIVYYLFTPFPWQIKTPVELVVGITAIGLFGATILSRRGIALLLHEHPEYLLVLLSYVIFGITTYAIVEMNYGAAVRRRIQFIPIIILLAVVGLSRLRIEVRGIE